MPLVTVSPYTTSLLLLPVAPASRAAVTKARTAPSRVSFSTPWPRLSTCREGPPEERREREKRERKEKEKGERERREKIEGDEIIRVLVRYFVSV